MQKFRNFQYLKAQIYTNNNQLFEYFFFFFFLFSSLLFSALFFLYNFFYHILHIQRLPFEVSQQSNALKSNYKII